jgi:RsiW-degrading membrane proteinase PrsW (M82 family)
VTETPVACALNVAEDLMLDTPNSFVAEACLGLGPVLLFLAALLWLDSFRLVRFRTVIALIGLGMVAAIACYAVSGAAMDALHLGFPDYSRYAAPLTEEGMKAMIVIWLFARNRIGFMIDAAILGAAVGAGFSIFENVYYAYVFPEANLGVWIVRGVGTAIMHAGATALFAVCSQALRERHEDIGAFVYLPGFLIAASLHSIFNQFASQPLAAATGTVVLLPLAMLYIFDKSEHQAHDWLVDDYTSHEKLLNDIRSGLFTNGEAGRFIRTLAARSSNAVVAMIFEYIQLHTQLVLRAEQILLGKESGTQALPIAQNRENFARLHVLERKIGRSVMLALWPHLKFSRRELYELHQLEKGAIR